MLRLHVTRWQAEAQIRQAAEAVVALKARVFEEQTRQRVRQNSQHAADVLAAQIPRLELYQGMSVRLPDLPGTPPPSAANFYRGSAYAADVLSSGCSMASHCLPFNLNPPPPPPPNI